MYCVDGLSRSPFFVAGYLHLRMGLSVAEAEALIAARRPIPLSLNRAFRSQLACLERCGGDIGRCPSPHYPRVIPPPLCR